MPGEMDFDKAIGHESKPEAVGWNQRDILLYAAGIGAKRDELDFLFEDRETWHPFPTYPLVLGFRGDSQNVVKFTPGAMGPGIPALDAKRLVHAEQSIEILKTIPANANEKGWHLKRKCVGVKDTGKGLIIDSSSELYSPAGELYVRMVSSAYCFGEYTKGTKWAGYSKSIAPKQPVKANSKPPQRQPDLVLSEKTTEEQAIIYRLSGDYNPLHIEPSIGKAMGFKGAILHGLASYGHAARALVLKVANGDGSRLIYMSGRFTSPVMPGDELETSMWTSEVDGNIRVDFVQQNKTSGKLSLGGGVALFRKEAGKTKL